MANIRVNPETWSNPARRERSKTCQLASPEPADARTCALNPPGLAYFGPLRARLSAFSGPFLHRPMAFENPVPSFFARLNVHGRQGCAVEPRTTRSTSIVVTLAIG